jgi:hypothetical protein
LNKKFDATQERSRLDAGSALITDEKRMAKLLGYFSVSKYYGMTALKREVPGDPGEREEENWKAFEDATKIIFPFTQENGTRFWLISDADRFLKLILLAG